MTSKRSREDSMTSSDSIFSPVHKMANQQSSPVQTISEQFREPTLSEIMTELKGGCQAMNDRLDHLNTKLDNIKQELSDNLKREVDVITTRINTIETRMTTDAGNAPNKSKIVIKRLLVDKDSNNDEIKNKVFEILSELDIGFNIAINNVYQAPLMGGRNTSPIIVTLANGQQRDAVLRNKKKLSQSARYSRVYIEADKPRSERQLENSIRTLVHHTPNLVYRKGRVQLLNQAPTGRDTATQHKSLATAPQPNAQVLMQRDRQPQSMGQAPPSRDRQPQPTARAPPQRDYASQSTARAPSQRDYAAQSTARAPPPRDYTSQSTAQALPPRDYTSQSTARAPPPLDYTSQSTAQAPPPRDYTSQSMAQAPPPRDYTSQSMAQAPPPRDYTAQSTAQAPPPRDYAAQSTAQTPSPHNHAPQTRYVMSPRDRPLEQTPLRQHTIIDTSPQTSY